MSGTPRDPWQFLSAHTTARIALGRAGASLPTRELLAFELAHAQARDAVHAKMDRADLTARVHALGVMTVEVESEAAARPVYLRRPDLGRRLSAASRDRLSANAMPCDLVLIIGDGLSATASAMYAPTVIAALLPQITRLNLLLGPVVIAEGARVALGDEVGEILSAKLVAVLIGERPGLSAANSMSVYLTYNPRPGRSDAQRNCISNIREGGLDPARAALNLAWLIEAALQMKVTGVTLKDRSDVLLSQEARSAGSLKSPNDG